MFSLPMVESVSIVLTAFLFSLLCLSLSLTHTHKLINLIFNQIWRRDLKTTRFNCFVSYEIEPLLFTQIFVCSFHKMTFFCTNSKRFAILNDLLFVLFLMREQNRFQTTLRGSCGSSSIVIYVPRMFCFKASSKESCFSTRFLENNWGIEKKLISFISVKITGGFRFFREQNRSQTTLRDGCGGLSFVIYVARVFYFEATMVFLEKILFLLAFLEGNCGRGKK